MRNDVIHWLEGTPTGKRPSKETLNHPELIHLASGRDPFRETPEAYRRAYEALGIDIVNIVPEENAPPPLAPGQIASRHGGQVQESYLGVFNASCRVRFPFASPADFWAADFASLEYADLYLPGAQYLMPCAPDAIEGKDALISDIGLYYYQLYTTLFMWGVEALGWEIFLLTAAMDPERFDRHFLDPVFEKSKTIMTMLADLDTPWIFCHDDIATGTGPVFRPEWYDTYVFPRYAELWKIPHSRGKKVFLTADGKVDWALEALRETGCDGIMFESPATDLEAMADVWGDAFFIGGIDAGILGRGTPEQVRRHVEQVVHQTRDCKGFALCCSGGLVGNMPLENLATYFDVRAECGYTRADWRGQD